MTSQEVKELLTPNVLDFGVVDSGAKMPFTIKNNSPFPIEGHSLSCGCVGLVTSKEWEVTGEISAEYKDNKKQELYLVDGKYCQLIAQPQGNKYLGLEDKTFVNDPKDIKKVTVSKFDQAITIRFNDGKAMENKKESGEIVENTEKLKTDVKVSFYVVKNQ